MKKSFGLMLVVLAGLSIAFSVALVRPTHTVRIDLVRVVVDRPLMAEHCDTIDAPRQSWCREVVDAGEILIVPTRSSVKLPKDDLSRAAQVAARAVSDTGLPVSTILIVQIVLDDRDTVINCPKMGGGGPVLILECTFGNESDVQSPQPVETETTPPPEVST